jgi:uncharacterized protein with ParB-like and HNH nuclease domain/predicted transport protein
MRAGTSDNIKAHFLGSIVFIQRGDYMFSDTPVLLIDGQQRLTSITLLLSALQKILAKSGGEPLEGFSSEKIRGYYLLNTFESGENRYKLLLSKTDKDSLVEILGGPPAASESIRIKRSYELFKSRLEALGDDLAPLCQGLRKLTVVGISLTQGEDNPQLIFESMNSTGLGLSQADLIRNYLLMGLGASEQTMLYEHYWLPMEIGFGQEAYATDFDKFMRHYLTLKTWKIPKFDRVYAAFKSYASDFEAGGPEELLSDMLSFSNYYCAMVLKPEKEKDAGLARAFGDLLELKADPVYPFLLEAYDDFAKGILSRDDFLEIARLTESYVFRRSACSIPSNSLNLTFAIFTRGLGKERYLESVKAKFLALEDYKRFPSDEEFKKALPLWRLYKSGQKAYCLGRLENYGTKEPINTGNYTIEHILPQNPILSKEWREELGEGWQKVRENWLHTLGNLTLTGYNSTYSDKPFSEKRKMEGGFKDSHLRLNQGLESVERWNEEAIVERGRRLSELALKVWPAPFLPPEVLAEYAERKQEMKAYSISDHPALLKGYSKLLYDALRARVLELSSDVTENFLKFYVSFKCGRSFMDLSPRTAFLRLFLNLGIEELDDPLRLAKDVRGLGHWGVGNVMVVFEKLEDLDNVMALVKQAFDKRQ